MANHIDQNTTMESTLIDLVRERPCTYLKSDLNYKNKVKKEGSWSEISLNMNMTVKECQKMWASLKQQFQKWIRKTKNPSGSEAGSKPYFRHQEAMSFLRETVEPDEKTLSNLHDEGSIDDGNEVSGDLPTFDINEVVEAENPDTPAVAAVLVPRFITPSQDGRSNKRAKLDAFDKELLKLATNDDEFDAYGKMLASKLRNLFEKDRRTGLQLQLAINNLVCEAEIDTL